MGEEVKRAKIGHNLGESGTQELFKYHISFSVASAVCEICAAKETPLLTSIFNLFSTYFRNVWLIRTPFPPSISPEFGKKVYSIP